MYAFNGKKSYHFLHHVVCCLFGIAFFGFLAKEISDNELIGAVVGLIGGWLSIWCCLFAKTLKDFILSVMVGKFVVEFFYTFLCTHFISESPSTFYEVIKMIGIICTIIYSCLCTPDIKLTTSIVGGGFIYNAFCMISTTLFEGLPFSNMKVHLILPVFTIIGYLVQQRKPSTLKKDIEVPFNASGKIF